MKKIRLNGLIESNCYILDKQGECFIIDPGSDIESILEAIGDLKVKGILLTHGHFDHVDLIGSFIVPIYIHKNDDILLKRKELSLYNIFNLEPSYYYPNLEIIKIDDGDEIDFQNEKIKVIHTPGHTSGSVCFLYKNKLFSGDTLFKNGIGRTDFPTSSEIEMKKSINKIINNLDENIVVYPGHDEKTTIKEEKGNNPYYLYYKEHY